MFNHHLTWLLVLINGSEQGKRWLVINLHSQMGTITHSRHQVNWQLIFARAGGWGEIKMNVFQLIYNLVLQGTNRSKTKSGGGKERVKKGLRCKKKSVWDGLETCRRKNIIGLSLKMYTSWTFFWWLFKIFIQLKKIKLGQQNFLTQSFCCSTLQECTGSSTSSLPLLCVLSARLSSQLVARVSSRPGGCLPDGWWEQSGLTGSW